MHNTNSSPKADILLVDDTPENLRVLSKILTMYGYKARSVSDGMMALRVALSSPPDLIMMDINMPGLDGYKTCAQLKADERTRHIPVIFLSAMAEVDDKVRGFEAGGVDYITKPFQVDELACLETHLSIRRLQEQLETANAELGKRLSDLSRVEEAERQQRIFAETLVDTIAAVNSSLDYNEVLDLILANMARVVPHDTANIALLDSKKNVHILRARGYEGHGGESYLLVKQIPLDQQSTWMKVYQCHCPVVVNDTQKDSDWVQIPELGWLRSHICVPIISKERVFGFLNLDSAEPDFFTQEHARRLKTFADQAAVAIEKARLFDQAQHLATVDGLTGVFNRRHLLELARREFERSRRYRHNLSALMIDLDHFKHINDIYGHPIGDQALITLASRCTRNLRPSDLFGRYGGEEFLVLLPETTLAQAMEVAERLRSQIEQIRLDTEKGLLRFTVSVGVSGMTAQADINLDQLIVQADDALYAAKAAGRNRVHA